MIVVQLGKEWNQGRCEWKDYIDGYFESKRHAEKYLVELGYEKDTDDVFFKELNSDTTDLAEIITLQKIPVNIF